MARKPRLVLPGVALHIVQRGNDRMACFKDDSDYLFYLGRLRALAPRHECNVHAYCLMRNHVHLLITPDTGSGCAMLMKELSQPYAHYFNTRYARTGTLWEGRYRACVAESARYVIACYRYIELNPVRAGVVGHPGLYPWSSYAVNCGERADPLIVSHAEFDALALHEQQRRVVYRDLLNQGLDQHTVRAIRSATSGGYPLGSETFKATLSKTTRKLDPGRPGRPAKKSVPDTDFFG